MSSRRVRLVMLVLAVTAAVLLLMTSGFVPNPFAPGPQGEVAAARSDRPGRRILFVGNSFTFFNSMPDLVNRMAEESGHEDVFIVHYTRPGWSLRQFAGDRGLRGLVEDVAWDDVVLQERSYVPALEDSRRASRMDPFAADLHMLNRVAGADTVLFMTWAYRDGDTRTVDGDTFAAMQTRIENAYEEVAGQLPAPVAPVGTAWAEALRRQPSVDLWADDGRHPSPAGSYLAACVFYAVLLDADPRQTSFNGDLPPDEARFLQEVAADVVASYRR